MASNNQRAVAFLRKLAKHGPPQEDEHMGICWNLRHWMWVNGINSLVLNGRRYYDGYSIVEHGAEGWPHHSGSKAYPVPGKHHGNHYKWAGEEGALRRSLCLYIADRLEQ